MVDTKTLDLTGICKQLESPAYSHIHEKTTPGCRHARPSQEMIATIVERLRAVLFPGFYGEGTDLTRETLGEYIEVTLQKLVPLIHEQVLRDLCFSCTLHEPDCEIRADRITQSLFEGLPEIQQLLADDVEASYVGDPASKSHDEVILTYPGLLALTHHRIAHTFYQQGAPLLARMISERAHSMTGIDIHPRAKIGRRFFMDHGTGIVIGATTVIGDNVRIYQGVTLGAKSFPLDENGNPVKGIDRHPIIEDNVTIYAGATLLGRITIGNGSVIGGNVWLTRSVPPGSRIAQASIRDERFSQGGGI